MSRGQMVLLFFRSHCRIVGPVAFEWAGIEWVELMVGTGNEERNLL